MIVSLDGLRELLLIEISTCRTNCQEYCRKIVKGNSEIYGHTVSDSITPSLCEFQTCPRADFMQCNAMPKKKIK